MLEELKKTSPFVIVCFKRKKCLAYKLQCYKHLVTCSVNSAHFIKFSLSFHDSEPLTVSGGNSPVLNAMTLLGKVVHYFFIHVRIFELAQYGAVQTYNKIERRTNK